MTGLDAILIVGIVSIVGTFSCLFWAMYMDIKEAKRRRNK